MRFRILGIERPFYLYNSLKILIDNPSSGGSTHTGLNRAMRLIKSRRAAPGRYHAQTGALLSIRILSHAVDQAEERRLDLLHKAYVQKLIAAHNYDQIKRTMTIPECKHLPMAGDLSKTQHNPTSSIVGWTYRMAVDRRFASKRTTDSPEKVAAARAAYA